MTLNTKILLDGPISGQAAFDLGLKALLLAAGRQDEFATVLVERTAAGQMPEWGILESHRARNDKIETQVGQGLPGIVECEFLSDGSPLATEDIYEEEDLGDGDVERYLTTRACGVRLSWDTGYAYRDRGLDCTKLHALALIDLHESLPEGVTMRWVNEYSDEMHSGIEGIEGFLGHGDSAQQWFSNVVLPMIEAAGVVKDEV